MEYDILEKITYITGDAEICSGIRKNAPVAPFSDEVTGFVIALSEGLFARKSLYRNMPDVAALAFWCRAGHVNKMKQEYERSYPRIGKRVSVHFAPSNIPLLFAYTMIAGLLAGTSVIVRLPSKTSEQEAIVVDVIKELLADQYATFTNRIILCRYPHDLSITDELSNLCDVRVIWGADRSVSEIRKSPLPPRAIEIPFAGRHSAAIISAKAVLELEDIDRLINDFYNDTYLNDQNACSSPHLIYWLGKDEDVNNAKKRFWDALYENLKDRNYQVQATVAVSKLDALMQLAAVKSGARITQMDNVITRIAVAALDSGVWSVCVPGGFFLEGQGASLEPMFAMLDETCQTLGYFGKEEILANVKESMPETFADDEFTMADVIVKAGLAGVDRIVPVGQSLDFELTWDGFDLIETMSRRVRET